MRTAMTLLALAGVALAAPADRAARAESCTDAAYNSEEGCEDEAPSSLKCVWTQRVAGGDYEDKSCKTESCSAINSENVEPEGKCKSFGGCTWDSDKYYCLGAGEKVPCSMSYVDHEAGEKCPSGCEYNAAVEGCIEAGGKPSCAAIYEDTLCTSQSGCSWTEDLYKCWETGSQIPCTEYEYMDKAQCPTYCEYISSGGSDTDMDGKCMAPGSKVACEEFYNGPGDSSGDSECPAERCKWYPEPIYKCWAKDKVLPCSTLYEESCAPSDTCKWMASGDGMGYCVDCPADETGKCVQTPSGGGGGGYDPDEPDDGKPCADHKDNGMAGSMCPEPRCFMEYTENMMAASCNGESGTCRAAECKDFMYDEEQCKSVSGCTFEADSNMCFDPNGVYPCTEVYEETACPTAKCDWIKPDCTGDDCYGDGFCVTKGESRPCNTYYEGGDCPSTCAYLPEMGCISSADADALPCSAYNSEANCPAPKCGKVDGVCWEVGKPLPCSAVCTPYECVATGRCLYNKGTDSTGMDMGGQCIECEGGACPTEKECNTFAGEEDCPESHCTWEFAEEYGPDAPDTDDSASKGQCVPHVCVSIYEKSECTGHSECTYTPDPTGEMGGGYCWPSAFKKPCKMWYDESPCTSASCSWNSEKYQCSEAGAKTACADNYEEADCGKDSTCSWADYECRVKSSLEPSTPPPLTGKGDGTGNEDMTKCTSELYSKVAPKLESAETECIVYRKRKNVDETRDRRTTKDQQLECLAYFLEQTPNTMTVTEACPCLWAWATEIEPWEDHWLKIAC